MWRKTDGDVAMTVTIPANCRALLIIASDLSISESGQAIWDGDTFVPASGIQAARRIGERVHMDIGSGTYSFRWPHGGPAGACLR